MSEAIGRLVGHGMRERRRILSRNVHRASADPLAGRALERATSDAFASYGRYWFELLRLPVIAGDAAAVNAGFEVVQFDNIERSVAAGRGTILALPHLGGWEHAGAWLAHQGYPPTVVVEAVQPPDLFEWFVGVRRALGMEIVPLGAHAGAAVARALRANRVVCLVCDRDLTGDGVEVEFFGERTTLPAGPAVLALRTGATLLPSAVYFRPHGGHVAFIDAPIPVVREGRVHDDVTRLTQQLADRLAALIRRAPRQWHLMQPNWPSDRRRSDDD